MSRYQKVNGELTEEGYRKYGNVRRKARKDIVGGALTSAAGAGVGMFGGYAARKLSGGKVNLRFTPKVVGSVMSAHGGKRMAGGAYDLALNRAGVTDDYGRLADSSNPLARPLIDGRKYALGAGAAVGAGVPYAVKALNKDKDNLLGEAIRKTSAKKRVVVKNVERGPGAKDFSMKNSTRKKLNKGFKILNAPEEGPAVNEGNKAEFIKPKQQRQNKKKVVVKNVERGPVVNEGNAPEPIKPEKKSKKKIFFKRKKKVNNPNNVGEDIDNLNEELMGKWKKGLKRIKHSSLGGNNMNYEDEIYHSGYLDGYYASMELCHADETAGNEATKEDKKAMRKKKWKRYGNRAKYYMKSYWRGIPAGLAVGTGIGALVGAYDANVFMRHSAMKYKRADDEDDFDYDKHMKRGRRSGHVDGALLALPVGYVGAMGVALRNPERRKRIISSMRRSGTNFSDNYYYNKVADGLEKASEATDRFVNRFKRRK